MSSESSHSEYDWADHKEMLKDQCERLNDKYLKVEIPKAELTKLVYELTELFEERMEYHDSLIEMGSQTEATQATLIDSAVRELTEILKCLAVEVRSHPSVKRKLRYDSSVSNADSNAD